MTEDQPGGDLHALIESSDLDGLVRYVDGVVAAREWDLLVSVGERCREAVDRGKQVWGVAQFVDYRLALDAPGSYAGPVVVDGAGRHSLGPLWEVAASNHSWDELGPHLTAPGPRAFAAHERVIRGDAVDASEIDTRVVDVPCRLFDWEPAYPVAVYRSDRADFPEHDLPDLAWMTLRDRVVDATTDGACDALLELVRPWVDESSGRAEAVVVEGSARDAVRALGPSRVRWAPIGLGSALQSMAWTGASGGAYGRRRGTPAGRAGAWWALAALLGIEDEWPIDGEELGREAEALQWYRWDPGDRVGGWNFHLAVSDPEDGLAWAVSAVDWR